jgi:peptidoglycan/LPS O-acetylase OafA/YrhL
VTGGFGLGSLEKSVLWSIICEVIYYILYPALLLASKRVGWIPLIMGSFFIAASLCLTHLHEIAAMAHDYQALGWSRTWIVGLPVWLLGCWLAENRQKFNAVTNRKIWFLRLSIFSLSVVLRVFKFHVHFIVFSNCFTMNAFALLIPAWVGIELASAGKLGVSRILEWMGGWSYSLYLVHNVVPTYLAMAGVPKNLDSEWYHLFTIAVALVASFIFYRLIEKPSHLLAVYASRRAPKLSWAAV